MIRSRYNVANVFRYASGAYRVNFSTALTTSTYAVIAASRNATSALGASSVRLFSYSPDGSSSYVYTTPTTSGFDFGVLAEGYTNGTDGDYVSVTVFSN